MHHFRNAVCLYLRFNSQELHNCSRLIYHNYRLLGLEVCALNTVQFSNHTGYGNWTGSRIEPSEIDSLYDGLKRNELVDFDMLLTGYVPGAEGVEAVGRIAKDLKELTGRMEKKEKFFWGE